MTVKCLLNCFCFRLFRFDETIHYYNNIICTLKSINVSIFNNDNQLSYYKHNN